MSYKNHLQSRTVRVDLEGHGDYLTLPDACAFVKLQPRDFFNYWVIEVNAGDYANTPKFDIPEWTIVRGVGNTGPQRAPAARIAMANVSDPNSTYSIRMGLGCVISNLSINGGTPTVVFNNDHAFIDAQGWSDTYGFNGGGCVLNNCVIDSGNYAQIAPPWFYTVRILGGSFAGVTQRGTITGCTIEGNGLGTTVTRMDGAGLISYTEYPSGSGPGRVFAFYVASGATTDQWIDVEFCRIFDDEGGLALGDKGMFVNAGTHVRLFSTRFPLDWRILGAGAVVKERHPTPQQLGTAISTSTKTITTNYTSDAYNECVYEVTAAGGDLFLSPSITEIGQAFVIVNQSGGNFTLKGGGGLIEGAADRIVTPGERFIVQKDPGGDWVIIGASGVSAAVEELAICQARRTTDFAVTGTWTDVPLDATDEESDSAVIDHSVTTDNIILKETGNYLIGYSSNMDYDNSGVSADSKFLGRMRLNDTTVIPGTLSRLGQHYSGTGTFGEDPIALRWTVISATANDFITTQLQRTDDASATFNAQDVTMFAVRLRGVKGDTGATGAGANIIVQEDDVTVGTVTATLNLEGSAITSAVDDGGNKTTVTIDGGLDEQVILNDTITPTTLAVATHDWSPTGLSTCNVIRASSSAAIDLTGIVAQPAGTLILFVNIGAQNIKLKNSSASSAAANRFIADADLTIKGNTSKWIWYDGTTSRWRHTQI